MKTGCFYFGCYSSNSIIPYAQEKPKAKGTPPTKNSSLDEKISIVKQHSDSLSPTFMDSSHNSDNVRKITLSNSTLTGPGKIIYEDGTTEEGSFQNGQLNGLGKRTIPLQGKIFEGEFKNGRLTGPGKITYADGTTEEGSFHNGQLNGLGNRTIPSQGKIFVGEFKNGRLNGQGQITNIDGTASIGYFKDNELHGYGSVVYPNGGIIEGSFVEDILHGPGSITSPAVLGREARYVEGIFDESCLIQSGGVYRSGSGKIRILPENAENSNGD